MGEQHFCLRWNNYRTNITAEFETLREAEHFVDVTLACDGKQLKAHRVVLSACSPYFKELLQGAPCSHPIVILKDIAYSHMRSLLEFMYQGEVNISQAHLGSFLHTAEVLKIRGLAESSEERNEKLGNNDVSPISALKTTLKTFSGGIPLGLAQPLIDRHRLAPHMLPPPGAATETVGAQSLLSFSTSGGPDRCDGTAINLSPSATASASSSFAADHQQHHQQQLVETCEARREAKSPILLPISKRIRADQRATGQLRLAAAASKNFAGDAAPPVATPHNGCQPAANSFGPPGDTGSSTLNTTAECPSGVVIKSEDQDGEIAPKIEPIDQPMSDTEGSTGYMEEDSGGGLGEPCSPGSSFNIPSTSKNSTMDHAESAIQILHSIGPESHLQGPLYADGERLHPLDDQKELRGEHRLSPSSPPLPPSSLPHSCQLCGKLISCRRNLWKHMERVHFTNPAVQCSLCSKMFKNKYALKDHQRIYHGGLSEPMQVGGATSSQQPSLLSRILLDSRQLQQHPPADPRGVVENPQISPRLPPPTYRSRPPEEQDAAPTNYSMSSTSLMPSFPGQLLPVRGPQQGPHGGWPQQEDPYALGSRSVFSSEDHHSLSKTE